jgi:lipid-binding SYLF domain-containing protein
MDHRVRALVFVLLLAGAALPSAQPADSQESQRLRSATVVLTEVMGAPDQAVPSSVLGKAEGIAIFPSTVKGGFVFGGMRGRGVLSARTPEGGWSPPTFMTMTGGSFGLQIGGEAVDVILLIMNRKGLENFLRNQFKFGANAAAAAGPVGRDAQASTDLQLRAEILSYSRARGLFAGLTLNGATVRTDRDANERFYGKPLDGPQVALQGLAEARQPIPEWTATIAKYAARYVGSPRGRQLAAATGTERRGGCASIMNET